MKKMPFGPLVPFLISKPHLFYWLIYLHVKIAKKIVHVSYIEKLEDKKWSVEMLWHFKTCFGI
jgi:hypothetical protein